MSPTAAARKPPLSATRTGTQGRFAHRGTRTTAARSTRPRATGTTTCQRSSRLAGRGATRPTTATATSETPASRSSARPTGDSMAHDATPPRRAGVSSVVRPGVVLGAVDGRDDRLDGRRDDRRVDTDAPEDAVPDSTLDVGRGPGVATGGERVLGVVEHPDVRGALDLREGVDEGRDRAVAGAGDRERLAAVAHARL